MVTLIPPSFFPWVVLTLEITVPTRSHNLFVVPTFTTNYNSASFFPRVLTLANSIANKVDFFLMSKFLNKMFPHQFSI
ncbi:putative RNA-directed DNA polymerase, partial [Aphis craccivora]